MALGPDPCAVVERLRSSASVSCLRGNCDRWVAFGSVPLPPQDQRTEEALRGGLRLARCCAFAEGQLSLCDGVSWLAELPCVVRLELPGGKRLLAVHGSPKSDEEGSGERMPTERIQEIVRSAEADVILAGHTHRGYSTTVEGVQVHAVASVSRPAGLDKAAAYAILEATARGVTLVQRSVTYDYRRTVVRAEAMRYPGAESLARSFGHG